jgi:N-dimethylarginine dimethylaminohydrolase
MQHAPANTGAIWVDHEFGTLTEVVVGRPDGLTLPVLTEEMASEIDELNQLDPEFHTSGQGKLLVDFAPALAARIAEQVDGLATLLQARGLTVHRPRPLTAAEQLYPGNGQPGGSLIFMRDPIVVIGDRIIELAMRYPFRRRQKFTLRETLQRRAAEAGALFVAMPEPKPIPMEAGWGDGPFLEGGDVLLNGRHIYVGLSGHASSASGAAWLQRLLGNGHAVETVAVSKGFIHLDCVLSLPRPGLALACLEALPDGLPASLAGWEVIEVSLDEARRLGCNGLILDTQTYVMDATHQRLAEELSKRGTEVITVPYDAPAMFGGGLRCSHHPLRRA